MAFLDNNPTFTYVKVSNLSILYQDRMYAIQDIYTNCKYLYWDTTSPNMLNETNIRPTQSATIWLVCINDKGIHTEVVHDELTYVFSGFASSTGGSGVADGEFTALKVQVDENTEKYYTLSTQVDGVTEIIGSEEMEDGSIIKNLNILKKSADEVSLKVSDIITEMSDDYKEIRDGVSDSLISLLSSISTLKMDFEDFADDKELSTEAKQLLESEMITVSGHVVKLEGFIDRVLEILQNAGQAEHYNALKSSMDKTRTDVNSMINMIEKVISDNEISSADVTTTLLSIGNASQSLGTLKASIDEIVTLGLGGTIYNNYSQLYINHEKIQTTVGSFQEGLDKTIVSSKVMYYGSTSVTDLTGGEWVDELPNTGDKYVWIKIVNTYSDGSTSETPPSCIAPQKGEKGEDGTSVKILGIYGSEEELYQAHPSGNENGDGYIIDRDLYVWDGKQFINVGQIKGDKGEQGATSYVHIKYSNDGGQTFTSNNGEDVGIYMGVCTNFEQISPMDVSKYTWSLIKGQDGINGADGVDGTDGISIVWKGNYASHPSDPQNGWSYYNTTDKKSYVYQDKTWYQMTIDGKDGIDGNDGIDGLSLEYKGELSSPPSNPVKNWSYKDMDNGIVYIYTGTAWEVLTYDGNDGIDGANGTDGNSVFITYHDSLTKPSKPTSYGTSNGWHTDCTENSVWMSQKVSSASHIGTWGEPIKIKGTDGKDGKDGTSVTILGTYSSIEALNKAHPSDNENGDGYIIQGDLYVWDGKQFINAGKIQGDKGEPGKDGINGADGVNGKDGVSIVFKGTYTSHPSNPQNGWAYYNSTQKKSYVYQNNSWYQMSVDGVDGANGKDGKDGLSVEYKGELKDAPQNPIVNWVYRDTDNGIVYIYDGTAWKVLTHDGNDGEDGAKGIDGNGVYITYHDSLTTPSTPTGNGTTNGWHTNCTSSSVWISQKIAPSVSEGTWGTPVKIKGQDGEDGVDGQTSYFHVKYSNDAGKSFTTNNGEDVGMYMGTCVDFNQADPNTPSSYKWVLIQGKDGKDGIDGVDGTDGVNGKDGVSMIFKGTYTSHPSSPQNGWAYYNSTQGKSYVYQNGSWYQMTIDGTDGIDGKNGVDGLSVEWKGELTNPPSNPQKNWVYRDTDNGVVYIYDGTAWEVMTYDGTDGEDGADGTNGNSVYITYHDSATSTPVTPTGSGNTNGWHTNCTSSAVWISQKISNDATTGTWGTPVRIKGQDGKDGTNGTDGTDGVGVSSVVIEYAKNTSTSTAPTSGWSTGMPDYTSGYYLWQRTKVTYTNGSIVYSTATCDQSWKASANVYSQYEQLKNQFSWVIKSGTSATNMVLNENFYSLVTKNITLTADKINLSGYISANGNFTIDTSGNMTATGGKIGGFTIDSYILKGTNIGMCSGNNAEWAFWAGASNGADAPFHVGHNGELYATKARISGNITGETNMNIGATVNYNGVTTTVFKLASNGNLKIGGFSAYVHSDGERKGVAEITSEGTIWSCSKTDKYNYTAMAEGKLEIGNTGIDSSGAFLDRLVVISNGEIFISSPKDDNHTTRARELSIMGNYFSSPMYGSIDFGNSIYVTGGINTTKNICINENAQAYRGVDTSGEGIPLVHIGGDNISKFGYGSWNMNSSSVYNAGSQFLGGAQVSLMSKGKTYIGCDSSKKMVFLSYDSSNYTFRPDDTSQNVYLGVKSYPWKTVYAVNGCTTTSDRTLKENIQYLNYDNLNTKAITDDNISTQDCLDFITNDYLLATYNYPSDNKKELKLSAIAQDIISNIDGSDNTIGQLIVDAKSSANENAPLCMNQTQLLNVAIGAIQSLNDKVKTLETKIQELEK